jgi:hypothetical protein
MALRGMDHFTSDNDSMRPVRPLRSELSNQVWPEILQIIKPSIDLIYFSLQLLLLLISFISFQRAEYPCPVSTNLEHHRQQTEQRGGGDSNGKGKHEQAKALAYSEGVKAAKAIPAASPTETSQAKIHHHLIDEEEDIYRKRALPSRKRKKLLISLRIRFSP